MSSRTKSLLSLSVVLVAFLVGFVPKFRETRRLESELANTRTSLSSAELQHAIDEIRVLGGRILLEASRQNYGTAGERSTDYFNKIIELRDRSESPQLKAALADLANQRDTITTALAQGKTSVVSTLQALIEQTYNLPEGNAT